MLKRLPLLLLLTLPVACDAPHDSVDSIMTRQVQALRKLPEEERVRLMTSAEEQVADDEAEAAVIESGVLELAEAREIALRTNPDIHATRARLEAALSRIAEARSFYFPQLGMIHNSTRTFQTPVRRTRLTSTISPVPSVADVTQDPSFTNIFSLVTQTLLGRQTLSTGNLNSFSDHSTTFTATWTLFDGFTREARLLSAKHSYLASAMALADAERLLVRAVDTAFYQIQLGEEQLRIALADEEFSRRQLDDARRRFEAQKITKADVLNFEVRVRAAQTNVVSAAGLRDTGRVVLAELLALPGALLPAGVELAALADESEAEMTPPDIDEWIQKALALRPDLAQAEHMMHARKENITLTKGEYYPELLVTGSWGFERLANLAYSEGDQASGLGIEMRWQLFTGGFRNSQVRRAQAEWWEALATLKRKRLEIAADVRQTIVDLVNAQEQVRLQSINLESAQENRRIVEAEFAAGKSSVVRLNEAQRDYVETEGELVRARIELRQSWSDLRAAASAYKRPTNGNQHTLVDPLESD